MERNATDKLVLDGWAWFEADGNDARHAVDRDLALSFARCFKGVDGVAVINHLRRTILDRRLGPTASDAELRFLEGQRSVVAHILSMSEPNLS
jgi:hypothetical protein